jgi:hypothetical protein
VSTVHCEGLGLYPVVDLQLPVLLLLLCDLRVNFYQNFLNTTQRSMLLPFTQYRYKYIFEIAYSAVHTMEGYNRWK